MKNKINYIVYATLALLVAHTLINMFVGNKLSHSNFFASHDHHNYFNAIDKGATHGGIGGRSGHSIGKSNGSKEGILRLKGDNERRIQLMKSYKHYIYDSLDKENVVFNSSPVSSKPEPKKLPGMQEIDDEFSFKYNKLGLYGVIKVWSYIEDDKMVFTYFAYEHQLND